MIFHYFGSKTGLYEYLFQYSYGFVMKYFDGLADKITGLDYLDQYQYMVKVKLQAYMDNPYVFEFMTLFFIHPENLTISKNVQSLYEDIMQYRNETLSIIASTDNRAEFRDDLDVEKAKKYITWLIDGYSQSLLSVLSKAPLADVDLDPYWKEFDEILADLKKIFYKTK